MALAAFRQLVGLRVAWAAVAFAACLVAGARVLAEFNFGLPELQFLSACGFGGIGLFGVALAVLTTVEGMFDDRTSGTACCLLAREVRRSEYLLGRWVGSALVLAAYVVVTTGILWAVLALRAIELGGAAGSLAVPPTMALQLWLKCTLAAAIALVVCSAAGSAFFANSVSLLLVAVAHFQIYARDDGWLRWLRAGPDLNRFDALPAVASHNIWALGAYWAAYVSVLIAGAAWIFRRREF